MKRILIILLAICLITPLQGQTIIRANPFPRAIVATGGGSTLTNGLLGYWKLDETSGTTADDATDNNDGTTDATVNQAGKIGKCYLFASGQEVNMGDGADLKPTAGLSISAWFKQYAYAGTIASNGVVSGDGWVFHSIDGSGKVRFTSYVNYSAQTVTSDASVTTGSPLLWYHVVFTYNGTTGQVYINGEANGSSVALTNGLDYNAGSVFQLGVGVAIGGQCTGNIDEVGYWGRGLTSTEVVELYNSANGKTHPFTEVLWFIILLRPAIYRRNTFKMAA